MRCLSILRGSCVRRLRQHKEHTFYANMTAKHVSVNQVRKCLKLPCFALIVSLLDAFRSCAFAVAEWRAQAHACFARVASV